jgi:uncharacterized membrane-anchored protein YhcB (DUF1043 family)
MKKWLLTLLAGYAAGLAIAMKYRKDHKTDTETPQAEWATPKSRVDEFIDEVVDIHKTAYADIKTAVSVTLEEFKDLEELQVKINEFISAFKTEVDNKIAVISAEGSAKFDQIQQILEDLYARKQELLKNAGDKARSLSNISEDSIDGLLAEARTRLTDSYEKIKAELNDIKK